MNLTLDLLPRDYVPQFLKPTYTRDDRVVELLTVATAPPLSDGRVIIGIVTDTDGSRHVETWFANGAYLFRGKHTRDLFNTQACYRVGPDLGGTL